MTIKDIARIAGVGVSTVSRVLNNHPDVKDETREKILKVIKDSNYIPNNSARILKQNNTRNIGVLVKGVFNPFFSEMINIIGNEIHELGYTMILQQNDYTFDEDMDTLLGFIKEKRLQGVICLGGNFIDIKEESFDSINIPIVLTSVNTISNLGKNKYSSIGIDNKKSAHDVTKYLMELGHRNIAIMLGEKDDLGIGWWRLKGFKEALEEKDYYFSEDSILIGNYDTESAYSATRKLLNERRDITAIFAISDIMAIGVAKGVIDSKLKIGDDISIIGFDGMDISEFYNPGITTVRQPKQLMATKSIKHLFNLINKKENHKHLLLDTELIKRESCKVVNELVNILV
ncbi:MAG: LacI family DNA-binding transcriptional regulator [Clostridium perfringens]|nr:LacI family DNA-binding transcriptional regulator [Clostridium perfringens]